MKSYLACLVFAAEFIFVFILYFIINPYYYESIVNKKGDKYFTPLIMCDQ